MNCYLESKNILRTTFIILIKVKLDILYKKDFKI